MIRTVLGGLAGGLVLYVVGFLFWGTPLRGLAFSSVDDSRTATARAALAEALTPTGTGTYLIPNPYSGSAGTTLYGQGPVATVHFNTGGFPVVDSGSLVGGLVMALIAGLLIAGAMAIVGKHVASLRERAQVAVVFALAITFYVDLGQPVFNHHGWGYFVYLFLGDFIGFAAAGLVIARWFAPAPVAPAPVAPTASG